VRAAIIIKRREEDVSVHVYESRQDVPATQIVDLGAGRRMIAGGGDDSANAGAFNFDRTLR
jgi:hypothetical protein